MLLSLEVDQTLINLLKTFNKSSFLIKKNLMKKKKNIKKRVALVSSDKYDSRWRQIYKTQTLEGV